jgi:7-cyano-7-deazaguanine reductase
MSGRFDDLRERMKGSIRSPDEVDATVLAAEPYAYASRRAITVTIEQPEFTSVCPMTGLPDFGTVTVTYVPGERIVELRSLKFYLLQYRQVGIFYEHAVNRILDHLVELLDPVRMTVSIRYTPRGGIETTVAATHPER